MEPFLYIALLYFQAIFIVQLIYNTAVVAFCDFEFQVVWDVIELYAFINA